MGKDRLIPAGWKTSPNRNLSGMSDMVLAWGACRNALAGPKRQGDTETIDQSESANKTERLNTFLERYDWHAPIEMAPRDQTFALISRARRRKRADAPPLKSLADTRGVGPETIRIRGTSGDLLYDPIGH